MNTKRLHEVADRIESADHLVGNGNVDYPYARSDLVGFNMETLYGRHDCGTTGCIAGYAVSMYGRKSIYEIFEVVWDDAKKFLDLDTEEAEVLFDPSVWYSPKPAYRDIEPARAARACRNLADGVDMAEIWDHQP